MNRTQGSAGPHLWFNEHRHPALEVGPYSIPAFTLALAVSLAWICLRGRLYNPRELVAEIRNPEEAPQEGLRWLDKVFTVLHTSWLQTAIINPDGASKEWITALSCLEALSLCYTAAGPTDFEDRLACLLAATGWMLSLGFSGHPIFVTLSLFLSLPCALSIPHSLRHNTLLSGVLLLIFALDHHPVFNTLIDWKKCPWYWRPAFLCLCLSLAPLKHFLSTGVEFNLREVLPAISLPLCHICLLLCPLLASMALTTFMISCIGWKHLIFGIPSTPPSLGFFPFVIGSQVCIYSWAFVRMRLRAVRHAPATWETLRVIAQNEACIGVDTAGLACTIVVGTWLLILIGEYNGLIG